MRLSYDVFPAKDAQEWVRPTFRQYPWRIMKVGDAFFVPCLPLHERQTRARIFDACWKFARKNGLQLKIQMKRANRDGETGVVVERVL